MKVNQLSIGNLILVPNNQWAIVDEICDGIEGVVRVNIRERNDEVLFGFGCGEISGVQVSEYWLDLFGFENLPNSTGVINEYKHESLNPMLSVTFAWYEQMQLCYNGDLLCNFQYVHELQNIFFWLAGKQLKIKD